LAAFFIQYFLVGEGAADKIPYQESLRSQDPRTHKRKATEDYQAAAILEHRPSFHTYLEAIPRVT
jgi:hypothetical protein